MSKKKTVLGIVLIILAGLLVWGAQWATYARPPLPEALTALRSNDLVAVTDEPWLAFSSAQSYPTVGFIFYPGGRIDPRGYAPLMQAVASQGYLIVIPTMPLNMAPFNSNVASEIMVFYPEIQNWVIGGHSVGGTMAAQYTVNHTDEIDGVVIWASYPADTGDLSELSIPVTLIYGSLDPRVNTDSIAERQSLLPPDCEVVQIIGGDHHQFGAYKINPEEHFATISAEDQHQQIVDATLTLLSKINK